MLSLSRQPNEKHNASKPLSPSFHGHSYHERNIAIDGILVTIGIDRSGESVLIDIRASDLCNPASSNEIFFTLKEHDEIKQGTGT